MLSTRFCDLVNVRLPILGGHAVDVPLYGVIPPMPGFSGDIEEYCLYAGESCSAVNDIRPAAEIVERIAKEAERALAS